MNLLLAGGLPEEIDGAPISADFRNMVRLDLLLRDDAVPEREKTLIALNLLYPEIPADTAAALRGLLWFYSRGARGAEAGSRSEQPGPGGSPAAAPAPRAVDFERDAGLLCAAFYAAYGISLATVRFLHWWEFMALLEHLPDSTLMARVMYWRTADLAALGREEKKHVMKMRRLFAAGQGAAGRGEAPQTPEEWAGQKRARAARRAAEARKEKEDGLRRHAEI